MHRLRLLSIVLLLAVSQTRAQTYPASTPISVAIQKGDHAGLKSSLERGETLDWVDPRTHHTYLDLTFNNGDLDALMVLVEAGADVNAPDGMGMPPLIYAVRMGRVAQAQYLLAKGARIEDRDHTEQTALVAAVNSGNAEMVALLIRAGADINAVDRRDASLLQRASLANEQEIVKLLKAAGAKDKSAGDEMMAAAAYGDAARLRELLAAGAPVDYAGERGQTPLMAAAAKGQTAAVRALLAAGASVHATASSGQTPLFFALQGAHRSTIDAILDAGGDPRLNWGMGNMTSLMWLCSHMDDADLARKFIDAGVDVNAITTNGSRYTALMQAASFGRIQTMKVLLDAGAKVNIATVLEGDTALIDAARSGHIDAVAMLLRAGADPTARDHRTKNGRPDGEPIPGKTALDWAIQYHHPEVAALLQDIH